MEINGEDVIKNDDVIKAAKGLPNEGMSTKATMVSKVTGDNVLMFSEPFAFAMAGCLTM
jgi:hypothetical protein